MPSGDRSFLFNRLLFRLIGFQLGFFKVTAGKRIQTHVNISHKNECKTADQVTPPIVYQQMELGDDQYEDRNVMTETVFAGEQIEKLSAGYRFTVPASSHTKLAGLSENFLMGYCPGDAGYWQGQYKQIDNLGT